MLLSAESARKEAPVGVAPAPPEGDPVGVSSVAPAPRTSVAHTRPTPAHGISSAIPNPLGPASATRPTPAVGLKHANTLALSPGDALADEAVSRGLNVAPAGPSAAPRLSTPPVRANTAPNIIPSSATLDHPTMAQAVAARTQSAPSTELPSFEEYGRPSRPSGTPTGGPPSAAAQQMSGQQMSGQQMSGQQTSGQPSASATNTPSFETMVSATPAVAAPAKVAALAPDMTQARPGPAPSVTAAPAAMWDPATETAAHPLSYGANTPSKGVLGANVPPARSSSDTAWPATPPPPVSPSKLEWTNPGPSTAPSAAARPGLARDASQRPHAPNPVRERGRMQGTFTKPNTAMLDAVISPSEARDLAELARTKHKTRLMWRVR